MKTAQINQPSKIVRLKTYDREKCVETRFVRVHEGWEEFMGSYGDLVPFAVGSNQALEEIEETEEIVLWGLTILETTEIFDITKKEVTFTLRNRKLITPMQSRSMILSEREASHAALSLTMHNTPDVLRQAFGDKWSTIAASPFVCYSYGDPKSLYAAPIPSDFPEGEPVRTYAEQLTALFGNPPRI